MSGPGLRRLRASPKAESIRRLNREQQAAAQAQAEQQHERVQLAYESTATTSVQYAAWLLDWLREKHGLTLGMYKSGNITAKRKHQLYGELLAYDGMIHMLERTRFVKAKR